MLQILIRNASMRCYNEYPQHMFPWRNKEKYYMDTRLSYASHLLFVLLGAFYPWTPRDLTKAKAIMQYNLATAHAIRGEYDKASANLGEVCIIQHELLVTS